jgi:protein involved in polysaccharide export with SLBB domain
LFGLWLLAGCTLSRPPLDRELMAEKGGRARNEGVAECYSVYCPDVLAVAVTGRPDLSVRRTVGADGQIAVARGKRLRVEGRSTAEIARLIAQQLGVNPTWVRVQVAEFNSQQIYLSGQGISLQRAVAYQGPETVLDLLQRSGGVTGGAAPTDVHVIRSCIAEDRPPEVFHIDLHAMLINHDYSTNIRLQPFDQVHIGETRQSSLQKCIPPCVRPIYKSICGLRKSPSDNPDKIAR